MASTRKYSGECIEGKLIVTLGGRQGRFPYAPFHSTRAPCGRTADFPSDVLAQFHFQLYRLRTHMTLASVAIWQLSGQNAC